MQLVFFGNGNFDRLKKKERKKKKKEKKEKKKEKKEKEKREEREEIHTHIYLFDSIGMGKGSNVSKTNRARADAAKKAAEEGKGGGGAAGMAERRGAGALSVICAICRSSFMAQQTREQLMTHVDSKR